MAEISLRQSKSSKQPTNQTKAFLSSHIKKIVSQNHYMKIKSDSQQQQKKNTSNYIIIHFNFYLLMKFP